MEYWESSKTLKVAENEKHEEAGSPYIVSERVAMVVSVSEISSGRSGQLVWFESQVLRGAVFCVSGHGKNLGLRTNYRGIEILGWNSLGGFFLETCLLSFQSLLVQVR